MLNKSARFERKSFIYLILLAYKNFGISFRMQRDLSVNERDLLTLAFTSALILFMANLPVQIVKSNLIHEVESHIYIALIGFVSVFSLPLFLYFISWILFLVFKGFGGSAPFYEVRLALFWSLNVAAPLIIINGILKGFFYYTSFIEYVNLCSQIVIAWIIARMFAEAENFKSSLPTFIAAVGIITVPSILSVLV